MAAPTTQDQTNQNDSNRNNVVEHSDIQLKDSSLVENVIFFGATSMSVLLAFGFSFHRARRKDLEKLQKGKPEELNRIEAGTRLATRALMVGSVISVTGFSLMVLGVFKLMGVKNFWEFNDKMREYFPRAPSKGRTDFKNLKDLADYLISEDRKAEIETKKQERTMASELSGSESSDKS